MARSKDPKETVEKILETAERLFLEKGYDSTSMQDIVNGLGGLSRGAVYHHFQSKEEIMDAVCDRMFFSNDPFQAVRGRTDLNGLEKLREAIRISEADQARRSVTLQSIPILKNPRILAGMIESNRRVLTPRFYELIREGTLDGSIHTAYAKQLAELIPLMTSLWMAPSVFPATKQELRDKFAFIFDMLDKMGLPLADGSILALTDAFLEEMN